MLQPYTIELVCFLASHFYNDIKSFSLLTGCGIDVSVKFTAIELKIALNKQMLLSQLK